PRDPAMLRRHHRAERWTLTPLAVIGCRRILRSSAAWSEQAAMHVGPFVGPNPAVLGRTRPVGARLRADGMLRICRHFRARSRGRRALAMSLPARAAGWS